MDFNTEVLEKSKSTPVVVDFWAPWCGPCQSLGPIIESLAQQAGDTWELVKVNSDDHPEIAQQYGVKGIPAVKMFSRGKVVAEFTGALPKHQIEKWLQENLPNERDAELELILKQEDTAALEELVKAHPDFEKAKLQLAKAYLPNNAGEAEILINQLKNNLDMMDELLDLQSLIEFAQGDFTDGDKVSSLVNNAQEAYLQNNFADVFEQLIQSIMLNKGYEDELPRKVCVALFHQLGDNSELSKKYRKRFNMALY